jgi:uncharacterized protein YktB (UPF0637 family)
MSNTNLPKIKFSKSLIDVLKKLENENLYLALELLYMTKENAEYDNSLKITRVDLSKIPGSFDVTIDDKVFPMRIDIFSEYFLKNIVTKSDINKFLNRIKKLTNEKVNETKFIFSDKNIKVSEFKYNPKDIRSTFLSMVTMTYPHGYEEEVLKFLPQNIKKDIVGNYYYIIGDKPETMFTSHLDTADRNQSEVNLFSVIYKGDEYIITDGNTILGADDKSGVTVMIYMIAHKIPGLYYFFIGEERDRIGSKQLSYIYDELDYLKNIKRCISFDRRKTNSIITKQMGRNCCSNEFATALCEEFNKSGLKFSLDPTGVYTDSSSFIDQIPECTNISVGYNKEHTVYENQNMTYLIKLCQATLKVKWDSLPIVRKIKIDDKLLKKYKNLIKDIKKSVFNLDNKIIGNEEGTISISINLEGHSIDEIYNSLLKIDSILKSYKLNPDITFSDTNLKIELK